MPAQRVVAHCRHFSWQSLLSLNHALLCRCITDPRCAVALLCRGVASVCPAKRHHCHSHGYTLPCFTIATHGHTLLCSTIAIHCFALPLPRYAGLLFALATPNTSLPLPWFAPYSFAATLPRFDMLCHRYGLLRVALPNNGLPLLCGTRPCRATPSFCRAKPCLGIAAPDPDLPPHNLASLCRRPVASHGGRVGSRAITAARGSRLHRITIASTPARSISDIRRLR